ncbi:hypothetical protein F3Y22_tig00111027pilonHSYRG00044 [Hibiscus syriacus]|uniref:Uncharacterized protein n=1 Tax=Hibiscus syriacus TaxID=106335 RepID=A0A6A2Z457_HIBSY|nr:hypothetical protein F3Y22_tig00111027pilonHSYRG00044 [Hibiscus syriacus]
MLMSDGKKILFFPASSPKLLLLLPSSFVDISYILVCHYASMKEAGVREGSVIGKRNYRNGDLRDKLDRRLSPERRYSPRRDARDQQTLRGYSPLRSIDKKR